MVFGPPPESIAADLLALESKSHDRPFGVLYLGAPDLRFDAKEPSYPCHRTERYSGLSHAERSRIHPDEHRTWTLRFFGQRELFQIEVKRRACVREGVVDKLGRFGELKLSEVLVKPVEDLPELLVLLTSVHCLSFGFGPFEALRW